MSPEPAKGTVKAVLIDLRDEVGTTENMQVDADTVKVDTPK